MNDTALDLYQRVIKDRVSSGDVIVLDCGHFDSVLGADDFSLNTAKLATKLFDLTETERRNGAKIMFSVLIDDVGVQCSEDAMICLPKSLMPQQTRAAIPEEIEQILQNTTGFRTDRLKLFSEKTARNRGIQFFRKHLDDLLTHDETVFHEEAATDTTPARLFCQLENGTNVLMADMKTTSDWTGHCPLLMGMHYYDVTTWAARRFANTERVTIIDFSLNQDRGKVNAGARVARGMCAASADLSVANICFADDDLDLYTVDTHFPIEVYA